MPPELMIIAFAALILAAAAFDIATMEIPDWISIALVALFPVAALAGGFSFAEAGFHAACGAMALLVVFAMFHFGLMGGGDGKLIAAAAIWLGAIAMPSFIVWTTIAGGLLAIAALLARKAAPASAGHPAFLARLLRPQGGIPYAVAIAVGALAALPQTALYRAAGF